MRVTNRWFALLCAIAAVAGVAFLVFRREGGAGRDLLSPASIPANAVRSGDGRAGSLSNPATAPATSQSIEASTQTNWDDRYSKATDAYDFVAAASASALAGDGRAAYAVAEAVTRCAGSDRLLGSKEVADIVADKEQQLARIATLSVSDRNVILRRDIAFYAFCEKYARHDAFGGEPNSSEMHKRQFWMELAYKSGDTRALANHAQNDIDKAKELDDSAPAQRSALLNRAQADIDRALSKYDPAALFDIGTAIDHSNESKTYQGEILKLAACKLGLDCTQTNPKLALALECVSAGSCAAGLQYEDYLRETYLAAAPGLFATLNAQADELAAAIRHGDAELLREFSRIHIN
jgi:hypothetical protein